MKSIFQLFFVVFVFVACAARDELGPFNNRQSFDLKSGETIQVTEEGGKLPSCVDKQGQPSTEVHGQVRLFPEVSFLFDKYKDLKLVVSKGDFNCNQISKEKPVVLAIKRTQEGKFETTEVEFLVTKLELYNTKDFLENPKYEKNLKIAAEGMLMSVDQMKEFLLSAPQKDKITIAYFSNSLVSDPLKDEIESSIQYFSIPEFEGKTASECNKVWSEIQIFDDQKEMFLASIEGKKIKAMISGGTNNCYSLGSIIPFKIKQEDKSFVTIPNSEIRVTSVALLKQADFINNPLLSLYVSQEMNMTEKEFLSFLKSLNKDSVHLTRFSWELEAL